ncbi:isopenicillin N synthase family dioxygenase [Halioxenophilus sp. WMMB6]|uniref:isopenicillin N synthase family dioxygenase n=1 Tax=Halioxenophilus sp. WMMB6 TaxID=3073815 RepID=UPI00295F322A|nr:2-oxoglutarate and iron-dependent oxygenase domain-containing protein [Halioxenophilus sp. WMMB6]
MSETRQVPSLSLEDYFIPSSQKLFVDQFYNALAEFGFVVIRNHGIHPSLFKQAYRLAESLFNLPDTVKQRYETGSGQRGYISFGKETAAGFEYPDLKEYWHIGPELPGLSPYLKDYPANIWPDEIAEFREFFIELHQKLNNVAKQLLTALASAMELPADYFSEMICEGNSVQRLIHYPALEKVAASQGVRAAAHADINLMTLLIGATDSGLQLLDRDGKWLAIENELGDLVVDTGDMMARLTNSRLPATVHRVVNPTDNTRARYSIPFFVHPRNEVILDPLPKFVEEGSKLTTSMTAGEFLAERLRENGF